MLKGNLTIRVHVIHVQWHLFELRNVYIDTSVTSYIPYQRVSQTPQTTSGSPLCGLCCNGATRHKDKFISATWIHGYMGSLKWLNRKVDLQKPSLMAHICISRNTNMKYLRHYGLFMPDCRDVRFTA